MKEIVTPKGILKYRMPNILEAFDLLNSCGISDGETATLKLKRNIIASMSSCIDYSLIDGVNSYEDLINDVENMILPLSEIADEIIYKSFTAFRKKNL